MAEYILQILKMQLGIVFSWGFHCPIAIPNGLRFEVDGFKFCGSVEVQYNEGTDLFDISYIKNGNILDKTEGVFFDMLVNTIDLYVERTANYEQRVKQEYSII